MLNFRFWWFLVLKVGGQKLFFLIHSIKIYIIYKKCKKSERMYFNDIRAGDFSWLKVKISHFSFFSPWRPLVDSIIFILYSINLGGNFSRLKVKINHFYRNASTKLTYRSDEMSNLEVWWLVFLCFDISRWHFLCIYSLPSFFKFIC